MKNTITTIIVDDQPACIESLYTDLQQYPEIEVIATFVSAKKAKTAILKQQPQLLFLDMEMPEMSGLELLQETGHSLHSNICVVFYSAYDKYLIDALRISAFDYLLKPYLPNELEQIVERVKHKIKTNNIDFEQSIRKLLWEDHKFAVQTATGILILKCADILYFCYDNDLRSWQIIKTDGKTHRFRTGITAEEIIKINSAFYQVNQNNIINIDHLVSIDSSMRCMFFPPRNDLNITVSRRYFSRLKAHLEII
ncbi:MAG: LytTR family DNA-binding domain-containing protein [Prevotellaceae bacterium]|jgi:two-component system LytT family response regulator|nr:LytTR family DNA-binding domain-containing protein [Prevotellaceae bacterium]